jgi:solute carrier family 25 carnitine/acylcarnitine transporter 20/29
MSSIEASLSPVDAKVRGDMAAGAVAAAPVSSERKSDYKGFVAGVFSGIAKLSGMFYFLFPLTLGGRFVCW